MRAATTQTQSCNQHRTLSPFTGSRIKKGEKIEKARHSFKCAAHHVLNGNHPEVQLPSLFEEKALRYVHHQDKGFAASSTVLEKQAVAVI